MNVRDKYGTVESFSTLIDEETGFVKEEKEKVLILEQKEKEGIQVYPFPNLQVIKECNAEILYYKYDIFLASYSMGEDISILYEKYLDLIPLFERSWFVRYNYIQLLNMLSIGIILNIDSIIFDKLVKVVETNDVHDSLYDFLINEKNKEGGVYSDIFVYQRPYSSIKDIISTAQIDKEEAIKKLKKYLTKEWYRGHSTEGWYNIHKTNLGSHSGYWSFESGALVKILGLDDSSLKDCPYYPYDMVHWLDNK